MMLEAERIAAVLLCLEVMASVFTAAETASKGDNAWIESGALEHEIIGRYGEAYLERYYPPYNGSMLVLHVSGSYYDMAYQYGYLLNQTIVDCYHEMVGDLLGGFYEPIWLSFLNPLLFNLVGALLDGFYKTMEPFVPGEYKREIDAIRAGAEAAGVKNAELVKKAIERIMIACEVFSCSFFAAWGDRTVDGKMFATRNFDFTPLGGDDYRLITIFEPDDGNAYVTMGYPMFFGNAICGMNEKGIAVGQIGSNNLVSTTIGTPWLIVLTEILRKANSAAEGVIIRENYRNTFGMNYMVADGCADGIGEMQAYAIEASASFTAVFKDNDPKEDGAVYDGECYALKLEDVVFRADTAMDPRIRRTQTADSGPLGDPRGGESYINRYKRQYDMLVAYEKGESFVDYNKKKIIEATGKKILIGPKEAITIAKTVAMENESTISVVYGATDLDFWIAFSSVENGRWVGAYANPYIHFNLKELLNKRREGRDVEKGVSSREDILLAGASEVDITPRVGAPMGGYGGRIPPFSNGIHDPVYAKALVLDDGDDKVAIVTMDLVYPGSYMHQDVYEKIYPDTGIEESNLLICGSHTHSGPEPDLTLPQIKREFVDKISSAIIEADRDKKVAKIGVSCGYDYDLSMNRRYPDGLIDPEVGVIEVEDMEGNPIAVLVNFDAHGTVLRAGNKMISADYPGYMMRKVKEELCNNTVVMYSNGAEGDIETRALIDWKEMSVSEQFAAAEEIGEKLANDVLTILNEIKTVPYMDIEAAYSTIQLPPARISRDILWFIFWIPPYMSQSIPSLPCEIPIPPDTLHPSHTVVQAIRIGDSVLATIPGEALVETGLKIKEQSKRMGFEHTFVIGLANAYIGYIPTYEEYEVGGYEASASFYGPVLGEYIEAKVIDIIADLNR